MLVITWNMRGATAESDAWDYFSQINPDVAILQEVGGIPISVSATSTVKYEKAVKKDGSEQRFGTAVIVKGDLVAKLSLEAPYGWVNEQLLKFSGNLVGGTFNVGEHDQLQILSMYLPAWSILDSNELMEFNQQEVDSVRLDGYDEVFLSEIIWCAFRHKPPRDKKEWITGGDLNCSYTFEKKRGTTGSSQVLNRLIGIGLRECLMETHGKLVPTFRHSQGRIEDQLDHLYVTPHLFSKVRECNVGDPRVIFVKTLSDHLPIIAEIA